MTPQNEADDVSVVRKDDDGIDGTKHISKESETLDPQFLTSLSTLKERIRHHYELASDYYYSLWYVDMARMKGFLLATI